MPTGPGVAARYPVTSVLCFVYLVFSRPRHDRKRVEMLCWGPAAEDNGSVPVRPLLRLMAALWAYKSAQIVPWLVRHDAREPHQRTTFCTEWPLNQLRL